MSSWAGSRSSAHSTLYHRAPSALNPQGLCGGRCEWPAWPACLGCRVTRASPGARGGTCAQRPVSLGPAPRTDATGAGDGASGASIRSSGARDGENPQLSAGAITRLQVWFPRPWKLGLRVESFRGLGGDDEPFAVMRLGCFPRVKIRWLLSHLGG